MTTQKVPKVGIVVLNWNGWRDTIECLNTLHSVDYPCFQVIVVDNGSTDRSPEEIRARNPSVKIIETGSNLGYAGGNNVGLKYALEIGCDFVLLLNNDTLCPRDFLRPLVWGMVERQDAAFAGPVIYFNDARDRVWSAGARWSYLENKLALVSEIPNETSQPILNVESLVGCALMVRTSALESIGMLDESFFLMHEESDWCARAKKKGFGCVLVVQSSIYHKISVSFGGASSPLMQYFDQRNTLYWAQRHLPVAQFSRVLGSELAKIYRQMTGQGSAMSWREPRLITKRFYWRCHFLAQAAQRPALRARAMGYLHFLLRRTGDCPTWIRQLAKKPVTVDIG
jgi:GT2 family glycosyltransferase